MSPEQRRLHAQIDKRAMVASDGALLRTRAGRAAGSEALPPDTTVRFSAPVASCATLVHDAALPRQSLGYGPGRCGHSFGAQCSATAWRLPSTSRRDAGIPEGSPPVPSRDRCPRCGPVAAPPDEACGALRVQCQLQLRFSVLLGVENGADRERDHSCLVADPGTIEMEDEVVGEDGSEAALQAAVAIQPR
jgi:hypothetical protein